MHLAANPSSSLESYRLDNPACLHAPYAPFLQTQAVPSELPAHQPKPRRHASQNVPHATFGYRILLAVDHIV